MRKKIFSILILITLVFLELLVAKQFMGDRWFKKGYSELREYDAYGKETENAYSKPLLSDSSFRKALQWDDNNPETHYYLAKLYEKLMYKYDREMGTWETIDGKPVYNIGWLSKAFEDLAIKQYYRSIYLSPGANYYHLDLAWLLKTKLMVGNRTMEELIGSSGYSYEKPVNFSNVLKELKLAIALAPSRSYLHRYFADWIVDHICFLSKDRDIAEQYDKKLKFLSEEAVREYKKAVFLKPPLFNETLKSMTRLTFDYNVLKPIAQEDNTKLKNLVFFLYNKKEWEENREKFLADMDLQIDQYDFNNQSPEILYPYYNTLATLLQKEKKAEKVADVLQEYLKIDPAHAKTHFTLANFYLSVGKHESSKHYFERAIELDPENTSYLKKYVLVLASWKEPIEAETELKSLLKVNPENVLIGETLGNLYLRQKHFEKAEAVYRKITSKTPDKARGYLLLGKLYEGEGKQEKAKIAYEKFIFYTPDKARGYFLLGKMYERQKTKGKARKNYKKATLLNTRYKSYFNRMIHPDMLFEEYFKTTHDYDKLKKLVSLSPDSLNKLVLFLYGNNAWSRNKSRFMADLNRAKTNFEKSKGDTDKEKRIRPWLLSYYRTLADVYVEKGNYRKAVSVLNEATGIDPDNPEGHLLLAEYSFDSGNAHDYTWEFSKNHYETAISLSPENYKYEKAYAVSLTGVKKFEEAEDHMKKAIEKRPNDPELHEALGKIYEQAGKIDLAIDELSKAVSLSRGAEKYKKRLADLLTAE
ncbi:MAG: hypothetical protein SRB1_02110 [Desulfobacteraceae bacterium Eth-SRB1]|nr:MAG: hypothetical protein SRB1_02110 [Desulfobacteraceae bacterium Eth-SRB1]